MAILASCAREDCLQEHALFGLALSEGLSLFHRIRVSGRLLFASHSMQGMQFSLLYAFIVVAAWKDAPSLHDLMCFLSLYLYCSPHFSGVRLFPSIGLISFVLGLIVSYACETLSVLSWLSCVGWHGGGHLISALRLLSWLALFCDGSHLELSGLLRVIGWLFIPVIVVLLHIVK